MKRKILIAGLFLGGVASSNLSAQKYLGLSNSNYSGVYGSQYNPAKLTDEKVKVAVNLVSVNGLVNNDYYKFKNLNSFGGFTLDELGNGASHNGGNGALINLGIVGEVLGPSFQFTVNNKLGFCFSQQNLKRDITKIIQGKNALVAVSVMNSKGKTEVNINGNKKVPMLSVFKFHIALAVLDLVDRGILDLEQNIFVKKSELLENTWSPIRDKYPNGNVNIPLREIIEYTVSQSDNNGCDILLRLIGGVDTVQKFIESKGIKDFAIKYNEEEMNKNGKSIYSNYTTANASSRLLQKFYNGEIISESSRDFLFRIMYETSTGADRLISLLPPDVIVAHKTGTSGIVSGIQAATNDVGIIILPDDEYYTISVFVINSKENTSTNEKIIADISKTVWDYYFRNK